jgi:hypothetical protein
LICCFHSFFLKPLSVTLPFAARFTDGETASRARKRIEEPAKAKTVTVAKGQRGDAGAVFDLAPESRFGVGPVSSKRWGDGGRKKRRRQTTILTPSFGFWNSARSLRQISTDGLQFIPGSVDLPQSPAKAGAV